MINSLTGHLNTTHSRIVKEEPIDLRRRENPPTAAGLGVPLSGLLGLLFEVAGGGDAESRRPALQPARSSTALFTGGYVDFLALAVRSNLLAP
jgi:hypothetical protein